MAIMRTNRLTSKIEPPQKTQNTKGVTVSRQSRPMGISVAPSGELQARNAKLSATQWSAEQSNKEYADAIKKGEVVSINDPSIDPTTRKLVKASMMSNGKDAFGTVEDFTVPKGYKASSYRDIYGSDFNPEEYQAAAKSGKFDEYLKSKGYKEGQSWAPNFGSYTKYASKKEETMAEPMKMATLPAVKKLAPSGQLKERTTEKPTPADFIAPGVQKKTGVKTTSKTLTKGALNSSRPGMTEKGTTKLKGARVTTTETNTTGKNRDMMGYKRQEKLFKAYAGTSVLGESHIGKTAQDLNAYKKDFKSMRKEYRKEGNLEGVAASNMEIRQARQAEKFVKGPQTHFNTKNREKTTGIKSAIALDYRDSAQNAANRNTMQAKLDAISAKPKNNTSLY